MTLLKSIADLTKKVNDVTKEFNITEASLDAQVTSAQNNKTEVETIETNAQTIKLNANTAASNTATYRTSAESQITYSEITEILESKAITAVDVFVYDTSKDSDGGAWRKRCQHTSWYNETLNTATRGSRREFPAVAVIVLEAGKITVYDGDDPTMPIWREMVGLNRPYNNSLAEIWWRGSPNSKSVTAMNGKICAGQVLISSPSNGGGLFVFDMIGDFVTQRWSAYGLNTGYKADSIVEAIGGIIYEHFLPAIIASSVYDLAMTVLPDAPIDPATGLPVPTIAVATDGGVSVITHSGNVYDKSINSIRDISIFENKLYFSQSGAGDPLYYADLNTISSDNFGTYMFGYLSKSMNVPRYPLATKNDLVVSVKGFDRGFSRFNLSSPDQEISECHIKSDFNTGHMVGDIKGAFLADTNSSSMVGGELITNGNFDENLDGWTNLVNATWDNGQINCTNGSFYQSSIFTGKKNVTLSWNQTINSGTRTRVRLRNAGGTADVGPFYYYIGSGQKSIDISTDDGLSVLFFVEAADDVNFDNISLREIVSDRSVIKKPLQISEDKFEPDLDLYFIPDDYKVNNTETDFSSALNHTRDSNATMVDSDGKIKWAPHNLLTYSEEFNQSNWSKTKVTVDGTTGYLAPDGTNTADKLTETLDSTNESHSIYNGNLSVVGNTTYTYRFYIKSNGRTKIRIVGVSTSWGSQSCNFDLIAETATANLSNGTITNVGDGWFLCSWIATTLGSFSTYSGTIARQVIFLLDDSGQYLYQGDGTSGVYIWGAHLYRSDLGGMVDNPDQPTSLSSYVPTTSSAVYLPRRNHYGWDGSNWVNKGLLLESEQRTNLLTYSIPDSTNWTENNVTINENSSAEVAPDGTNTSSFVQINNATSQHAFFDTFSSASGVEYTYSIYVKSDGIQQWVQLASSTGFALGPYVNFDIINGSVGNVLTYTNYGIDDVGDGWYRIYVTDTSNNTTLANAFPLAFLEADTASRIPSFAGDGTSGVYAYGAQLEVGSTPSSYIPTVGVEEDRLEESLTGSSTIIPSYTDGFSIQMEGEINSNDNSEENITAFQLISTNIQRIDGNIHYNGSYNGSVIFLTYNGLSPYNASQGVPGSLGDGINVPYNIAVRHNDTTLKGAIDGTLTTSNMTPNSGVVDLSSAELKLGHINYMGTIKRFRMFGEDLTDTYIAAASSNQSLVKSVGTITRSPVATGSELVAYSGFDFAATNNYLYQPYNPDLAFGSGDFCIMWWNMALNTINQNRYLLGIYEPNIPQIRLGAYFIAGGHFSVIVNGGTGLYVSNLISNFNIWNFITISRKSGVLSVYCDGVLISSVNNTTNINTNNTDEFRIGGLSSLGPDLSKFALVRIGATAPTTDQIAKIYEDERKLFHPGAQCTLYGTSDAVTALAHDPKTNLLHVGTSAGRSTFDGLQRVDNTTTPVTTAISAVNGIIVEQ